MTGDDPRLAARAQGGGTADHGSQGAAVPPQCLPSGENRSADVHDADVQDYAGTPRPDAIVPALNEDQLAAFGEVGREWGRVSTAPQVWRQALPIDPTLGEYPADSEFRPARFTRFVAVAGRDGQLPPIETTRAAEESPAAAARAGQAVSQLLFGPPLDVSAIAVERMRKLVALPVLSADVSRPIQGGGGGRFDPDEVAAGGFHEIRAASWAIVTPFVKNTRCHSRWVQTDPKGLGVVPERCSR